VVVVAGSPVDLPWADDVPALLWCWYPGQEGGHAVADVLFGDAEPGGRLPCTIPRRIEDTPAFHDTPPEPGRLRYQEDVFVGHRWYDEHGVEPRFPFGHGLGYTTFTIGAPRVDGRAVEVDVANTGDRAGSEVVQLYVGSHPRQLRAFSKVALAPGERTTWRYELTDRDLSRWDEAASCWRIDTDPPEVWVGRSSRDLAKG
jgi:beta-glucosidase